MVRVPQPSGLELPRSPLSQGRGEGVQGGTLAKNTGFTAVQTELRSPREAASRKLSAWAESLGLRWRKIKHSLGPLEQSTGSRKKTPSCDVSPVLCAAS